MAGISHVDAVDVLKSITDKCHLVVSREVLIVLPEDITSPPPSDRAKTSGNKSPPTTEDQHDKAKTPPSVQSENMSSPPPDVQTTKTSPAPEDQANKISIPPTNTDSSVTDTLTVSSTVVLSKSAEELRTFGEDLLQAASTAHDNEVVIEQVNEQLLEGAPQLESQPGDSIGDQQQVEVKEGDQTTVNVDDITALEEFAEQLQKATDEDQEREEITINVNTTSSEPRDNYVNYDIAQAVIVTSPSNGSLANSEASVTSNDPSTRESSEQLDNTKVDIKTVPTDAQPIAAKTESEVKKSEPKVLVPVTEVVVLSKGSGALGMNIIGGSDRSSFPFGKGLPGVFISKVPPIHLVCIIN